MFLFVVGLSLCHATAATTSFDLSGEITSGTGSLIAVRPAGTPIAGPIGVDSAAVTAGLAAAVDIVSIHLSVGPDCFTTDGTTALCPTGGALVPITSIDAAALTFSGGAPTGGTLVFSAVLPAFGNAPMTVSFDLGAGTFFADGFGLGTASGPASLVIPEPGTVALLGMGMLGLGVARRKRTQGR